MARFRARHQTVRDLYAKRNQLIHGAWVDAGPGLMQARSKWGKPWSFAVEVRMDEIEGLTEDLEAAVGELLAASFEIKGVVSGT